MSAPKFTVERRTFNGEPVTWIARDGRDIFCTQDPDLARVIESHAGMVEALEEAQTLMPLGTTKRAEWMARAWAALAKARGEAQP